MRLESQILYRHWLFIKAICVLPHVCVTKAAEVLGVRRATLSALLHAKAALSPEMALRIEKAFGVSMDMLMRMQAWHDTTRMRAKAHEIKVQRYRRLEC